MSRRDSIDIFNTPYERQRWEDRYGDGPLKPIAFKETKEYVQIGDEIYKVSDLERAHIEHPQPNSHPFKPHHYQVQKEMDQLKEFFRKNPDRKPVRLT